MTLEQGLVFAVLGITLVLFAWGRWRYDLVALGALLAATLLGLVPAAEAFSGLGHPAVVTVAAVLVISRGLVHAGVVDSVARLVTRVGDRPGVQVATLTALVALASAFMNNVGALALLMPVAVWMARQAGRSPSFLLMPLAFGSLLGGMLTLIGTPPNIIIASYRQEAGGEAFGMFDFLPVGGVVTLAGVLFIALVGWRLTPRRREEGGDDGPFEVSDYLTEVRVPEGGRFAGSTLHDLMTALKDEAEVVVVGLVRAGEQQEMPSMYKVLREGDILLVRADSESLETLLEVTGLELAEEGGGKAGEEGMESGELTLTEAIVAPDALLAGTTATALQLRERHGVNVLAVARQGKRLRQRLGRIRFAPGDILLLQAPEEDMNNRLAALGCLPLASRGLRIGRPRRVLLASGLFAVALAAVGLGWVAPAIALSVAGLAMVAVRLIAPREVYDSIDMPVIVLLAAMLPIGRALETTGGSGLIASGLLAAAGTLPPAATLALLMGSVMLLSNVVNNAAAAVLAAPVAVAVARGLESSPDPFLMAVAVGASCAFLTPIGHQSNTLVMEPGGYRFGDYWRMGLPLSALVMAVAVPAILWVWPP